MSDAFQENSVQLSEVIRQDRWVLQVILNVISLSLEIPLRIFDRENARLFWARGCKKSVQFEQRFPSEREFQSVVHVISEDMQHGVKTIIDDELMWRSIYLDLGRSLWLTEACYEYPLLLAFRAYWPWRWWQSLWTLDLVATGPKIGYYVHFGSRDGEFRVCLHDLRGLDATLVAGPVWASLDDKGSEVFETHRAYPLVQKFSSAMQLAKQEQKYSTARLNRLADTRQAFALHDFDARIRIADVTLAHLLRMRVPCSHHLDKSVLISMTEWVLLCTLIRMNPNDLPTAAQGARRETQPNETTVAYRLDHSSGSPNSAAQRCKTGDWWIITKWAEFGPMDMHLTFRSPEDLDYAKKGGYLFEDASQPEERPFVQMLRSRLDTHLVDLAARYQAHKMENLYFIREWISDNLGVPTSAAAGDVSSQMHETSISYNIARRLCQLLDSELAAIYRYNAGTRELRVVGFYHNWDCFEKWKERFPEIMQKAGHEPEMRQTSRSYRAIDNAIYPFACMFDTRTGVPDPPEESSIRLSDDSIPGRSGIAVPIRVFERPWGIVEVIGARSYQFRWEDRKILDDVAVILSPFYYNYWLLRHLDKLNGVVVDINLDLQGKYNEICRRLAAIFSCRSVVLWIRSRERTEVLECRGWYNRPDLDAAPKSSDDGRTMFILESDSDTIPARVMRQGQVWWQGTIGEERLGGSWFEKSHTRGLKELNLMTAAFVPVPSRYGGYSGSVSLYSENLEYFHRKWKPIVHLVKRHLSILLETMHSREDWEKKARHVIAHEMKTGIQIVRDRARNVVALTEPVTSIPSETHQKLRLLLHDIETHSHDLLRTVALLSGDKLSQFLDANDDPALLAARRLLRAKKCVVDLREQFNVVFRSHKDAQRKKGIYIEYLGPRHGPKILVHPENLREILVNLLSNALKYTPNSGVVFAKILDRNWSVEFSLVNEGVCLEAGEESRLFQRGFRGSNALRVQKEGQGLGLFLAREICNLYGMELLYRSREKSGEAGNICFHEFILSFPKTMLMN